MNLNNISQIPGVHVDNYFQKNIHFIKKIKKIHKSTYDGLSINDREKNAKKSQKNIVSKKQ